MRIKSLILLIALAGLVCGQRASDPSSIKFQQAPPAQYDQQAAKSEADLELIRGFAARAFSFQNPLLKVATESSLADKLWSIDQPFSRDLLVKTYEFTKGLKPIERNATGSNADQVISKKQIDGVRGMVLSVISRNDLKLARRLTGQLEPEASNREQPLADRLAAEALLGAGDVGGSTKFAAQSIDDGIQPQMLDYLLRLRNQDEKSADGLFLRVLGRFTEQPDIDRMTLLYFGYYPFRTPQLTPEGQRLDWHSMLPIGGVSVWNVSGDRPGVSANIVRAYLQTTAAVLSILPTDPKQVKISYVAAYELSQNAQRWAPDLVPQFSATIQRLSADVPNSLTQPSTFGPLNGESPKDAAELLKEIDEVFAEAAHDRLCVWGVMSSVDHEKWSDAHVLAERIRALDLRAKMTSLVNYSEARKRLGRGEVEFALNVAEKLPATVSRPLLRLEIAGIQLKNGDKLGATNTLMNALKDARGIDTSHKPYLFLGVASELSRLDPVSAIQVFNEAISLLNASPGTRCAWTDVVEVDGTAIVEYHLLEFDKINRSDFATCVDRFFFLDPEGTVHVAMDLKDEQLMGQAMTTIASAVVRNRAKSALSRN